MKTINITILICTSFMLLLSTASKAMSSISISGKGQICGRIVDITTEKPLQSVSIDLYTSDGKKLVVGTLTNNKGIFTLTMLEPGEYILDVSLGGYNSFRVYNVLVKKNMIKNEIGDIKLQKKINKATRTTSRNKGPVYESAFAQI